MSEKGQMAVEFAIVLPVILMVMVIAIDCMVYVGQCAQFDHIAPQRILALAASPGRDAYDADARVTAVQEALAADFSVRGQSVEVECEDTSGVFSTTVVYCCTLKMAPWPLSGAGSSVFGMRVPMYLEHSYEFAFDPYTPGQLW